jgi:hypothetical protein
MTRRRRIGCVATALVAVTALASFAFLDRRELRLRIAVTRLRLVGGDTLEAAAKSVAARGEAGVALLEAVAFSPDLAPVDPETQAARQAALDALWEHEATPVGLERLARYLAEARGLDRLGAVATLRSMRDHGRGELATAAGLVTLTDTNTAASVGACEFLDELSDRHSREVLRRIAIESPCPETRAKAVGCLFAASLPGDEQVLRRALADPVEDVRIVAANALARNYRDAAGLTVLVAALKRTGWPRSAGALGLAALDDRHVVLALARALDGPGVEAIASDLASGLERITGHRLEDGRSWSAWLAEHASELPPQLDPAKVEVAPVLAPSR